MHHLMPMCVDFLYGSSVHCCKWGVKLPTIFVLLSISPFKVVSRYLIYCGDPMLGCIYIYSCCIFFLDCSFNHYVMSFFVSYNIYFKVYFVWYEYCYSGFLLIMEYFLLSSRFLFFSFFCNDFYFFHYSWFIVFYQFSAAQRGYPVTHKYTLFFLTLSCSITSDQTILSFSICMCPWDWNGSLEDSMYIQVLFLYPFSQSMSLSWCIQSIYVQGNYWYVCSYCHFVYCFGFIFVALFSSFFVLFSSLVLWSLSLVLCLDCFFLFWCASVVDFWFVVTMKFWYRSQYIYTRLFLSCWSLNCKCISSILHLYAPLLTISW